MIADLRASEHCTRIFHDSKRDTTEKKTSWTFCRSGDFLLVLEYDYEEYPFTQQLHVFRIVYKRKGNI
jgi:hypothetical protein